MLGGSNPGILPVTPFVSARPPTRLTEVCAMDVPHRAAHHRSTAASPLAPAPSDLIRIGSRRWFLQTGLAGVAGLSFPALLRQRAAAEALGATPRKTSVILFWLSGGPSHLDMWDPKPEAPVEVRGPFQSVGSSVPGVRLCEHLPQQASLLDKLTIIRSVDCSASNHTPITMQAGNGLARRTDDGRDGGGYPSMGSIVAKFRGPNDPGMPPFVGLADSWVADVWGAGQLGSAYEPVKGTELRGRLTLPQGVNLDRLQDRHGLRHQLDRLQRSLDNTENMSRSDLYTQKALDIVLSGKAAKAFNLEEESATLRDAYGRDSLGEKAILARRLVEAGVTYVLVSGAWGYWDHHGDNVQWGGIVKGLKPMLPRVDTVLSQLVNDLEAHGLLDSTLVLMMGEFGRSPVVNKEAGRDHWTSCMSMVVAGGGYRHGQVIGATDSKGYAISDRRITPSDLAATVYRHLGVETSSHWINPQGRPIPIVTEGGQPIPELT